VAGHFADPRAWAHQGAQTGRTFWFCRSRFRATLTELESTGIPAVSTQSLATGKSAELAREEIARAAVAEVTMLSMDDPFYPPRLKEIYDPPLILRVRATPRS
jgi:predicted Rossmann fold nucleotide-binding protein DprA/Smf involved in DNA uptake